MHPSSLSDLNLLRRSRLPLVTSSQHSVLATLNVQKTGSRQLESLVETLAPTLQSARNRSMIATIFSAKTPWRENLAARQHADAAHVARFARLGASRANAPDIEAIFFLTMLRDPAQRLYSEYTFLNGFISCGMARALPPELQHNTLPYWLHFQPVLCSRAAALGNALPPSRLTPSDPPSAHFQAYAKAHERKQKLRFEDWLNVTENCAHNRMARMLAPMGCAHRLADSPAAPGQEGRMLELALENLRSRTFFGLTEEYERSVRLINARLAADLRGNPLSSVRLPTPRAERLRAYPISSEAKAIVGRLSGVDVALYEEAKREFERLVVRYGVRPSDRLDWGRG